jgi:hypothetical protein
MADKDNHSDSDSSVNDDKDQPNYDPDDLMAALAMIKAAKGKFGVENGHFSLITHHCCFLVNVFPSFHSFIFY